MKVTGIVTQSRAAYPQWVSSYKFLFSLDCAQFTYYNDTNSHMVRLFTLLYTVMSPVLLFCSKHIICHETCNSFRDVNSFNILKILLNL